MKTSKQDSSRSPQINFKLTTEEKALFEKVAKARGGMGVSALIRMLVTDEARRLGIS